MNPESNGQPHVEVVPIESLVPDQGNVRRRDERAKRTLDASLRQFGPARSIVIDGNDVVRAGNGTLEAARNAGVTEVLVVNRHPNQLVAVKVDDWSPTEATAYSIADNRTVDLGAFDDQGLAEVLQSLQSEQFDIETIGYTGDELDGLISGLGDELLSGGCETDDGRGSKLEALANVVRAEPTSVVKRGEVYRLGSHTLICCDLFSEHSQFVAYLEGDAIFCPYPSPLLPLADTTKRFVLVQPDEYIASMMVDIFLVDHPADSVVKL